MKDIKQLIDEAEDFIISNDIYADIIKDGKLKKGAKLMAEFVISLKMPTNVEILLESSSIERYKTDERRIGFQEGAKWMRQLKPGDLRS